MLAEPFRRCVSLAQEDQWKNRTEKVVSGPVLLDHAQRELGPGPDVFTSRMPSSSV